MDILIFIGLLILGGLLNFLWEPPAKSVRGLAKGYLLLAIYLAFSVWVFYFAGIKNAFLLKSIEILIQYGGYLAHMFCGFLIGNIMLKLTGSSTPGDGQLLNGIVSATLWGISVTIANRFIGATVGKSVNMDYMIGFFKQSGYATWFLYFIMGAEPVAAIGILLHFKLKTGTYAAMGLILIMLGAVYTHWHNHDPFSDSYEAVIELVDLATILFVYYLEKKAHINRDTTQIYVV